MRRRWHLYRSLCSPITKQQQHLSSDMFLKSVSFWALLLFDSSSVTVYNLPSLTSFQSSRWRASPGLFPCSGHAGPPWVIKVLEGRRGTGSRKSLSCRLGPTATTTAAATTLPWAELLNPSLPCSWGKPLNTRAFSPPGRAEVSSLSHVGR